VSGRKGEPVSADLLRVGNVPRLHCLAELPGNDVADVVIADLLSCCGAAGEPGRSQ